jgi:hypothetical protein
MKGFATERELLGSARLTTPTVVKTPALVPYIRAQLKSLEMAEESDLNGTIHDPVVIEGTRVDRHWPQLFGYNPESQAETVWRTPSDVSIAPSHIISVDLSHHEIPTLVPLLAAPTTTTAPFPDRSQSTSDSINSHYSTSEERERSKDLLKSLEIPPLPLATSELHQWVQNLPWLLSGQHWCHDDTHACDLLETTADNISLSRDFLTVLMRSATAHKVGTVQRGVHSLLQEEVQGINGLDLIKSGRGFELFQTRVKTGFSRGLGTETYEAL